MKQYLLSVIHGDDDAVPEGVAIEEMFADVGAFNDELTAENRLVLAGGLHPQSRAWVADGTTGAVAEGPHTPLPQYQAGLWIIRAEDDEAAQRWAVKGSRACRAKVEVRPFHDDEGDVEG